MLFLFIFRVHVGKHEVQGKEFTASCPLFRDSKIRPWIKKSAAHVIDFYSQRFFISQKKSMLNIRNFLEH